jgi:riboflavin biosynthesis pyrimidine reductase
MTTPVAILTWLAAHTPPDIVGRPRVWLHWAQSLDGCLTDCPEGTRSYPLTRNDPDAQFLTHSLRAACAAILVGVGTIVSDDPQLTVRCGIHVDHQPRVVILDPHLRCPPTARCLSPRDCPGPALIMASTLACVTPADCAAMADRMEALEAAGAVVCWTAGLEDKRLDDVLYQLCARYHIRSLLVEGGARTLAHWLDTVSLYASVDSVVTLVAPEILGHGLRPCPSLPAHAHDLCAWPVGTRGIQALTYTLDDQ